MTIGNERNQTGNQILDRIVLHNDLSEMAKIPEWVEKLRVQVPIGANMQFAINLCLEEAVSNILRHGYGSSGAEAQVTVEFLEPRAGYLLFRVEDSAAPFNPLAAAETPLRDEDGAMHIGGRGIPLMRGFAETLEYERTASGNRLCIGFFNG